MNRIKILFYIQYITGENGMNFEETVDFLTEAENFGIIPGLDSIKRLCGKLGNPQDKLRIIHIAGTNGKGSAGTFINSILTEAGYKTGRFVTPAVNDYLEIIQYNGRNISETEFADIMTRVRSAADCIVSEGYPHPTLFELQTAAAFGFLEEKKCDFALIECGMGGKNDATNLITANELAVITSVSLEHTQFLGDTIEKIAAEKGGIIKENGSLVTVTQDPSVTQILKQICSEKKADFTAAELSEITDYSFTDSVQSFSYKDYRCLTISMLGKYQTENAAAAVEACRKLRKKGYRISDQDIYRGLASARWPGRFEVIRASAPVVIIDGAHNPSAAAKLRESIKLCFSGKHIAFVTGSFKDKNYTETARLTADLAEKIYTVTTDGKRSLSAEKLAEAIRPFNSSVTASGSVKAALEDAMSENYDVVIAFGTLSFIKKIRECVNSGYSCFRYQKIAQHSIFRDAVKKTELLEKDRIFCRHGMEHILSVARIAYITALENSMNLSRDIVYAAALLHDIGRAEEYETGRSHNDAGTELAETILHECGYSESETEYITAAVRSHGHDGCNEKATELEQIICDADRLSRNCFSCSAYEQCNWSKEKKNEKILY